ncbi:MAG TPA: DNA polymerase III subunit epsilon [Cellvibrionaceae bacterium]|nr:DNA polymerase III subunit epsilon [Cellvibrionaceae bacterium]HNG61561.1 DNA polymerase III subunit epsilon [Cellvibrionaceae bacterium]
MSRQIILDTETTGLEPQQGHRIIEIGCVELVNRKLTGRHFHHYINPQRDIDEGAQAVHGISAEFLADKPLFAQLAEAFFEFVKGAELIIHNAPFDVGFINHEFNLLDKGFGKLEDHCTIIDTLAMARHRHPGQKNNLDALCKRYEIDNSHRELHGALLDAEILADVYLAMTGGQITLSLGGEGQNADGSYAEKIIRVQRSKPGVIIKASAEELAEHEKKLAQIDKASGGNCLWLKPEFSHY